MEKVICKWLRHLFSRKLTNDSHVHNKQLELLQKILYDGVSAEARNTINTN
jgi:hypothetical protein